MKAGCAARPHGAFGLGGRQSMGTGHGFHRGGIAVLEKRVPRTAETHGVAVGLGGYR